MNWLRNFMMGRNGTDHLSLALMGVWLVMSLGFAFVPRELTWLRLLTYIPIAFCFFRMLSRNLLQRQKENQKFLQFFNGIKAKVKQKKTRMEQSKTHHFYQCPSCKQTLRLPKGRGVVRITCPKCGTVFERKT